MKEFNPNESQQYISYIKDNDLSFPKNQISFSFTDGLSGKAYADSSTTAIVVWDFVEIHGSFSEEIYKKITEIKDAHAVEPPEDWAKELRQRYPGKITEYTRAAFNPIKAEKAISYNDCSNEILIDDSKLIIKEIDDELVSQMMKDSWCREIVSNTMADMNAVRKGFGFTAQLGEKIAGGIGCYTLYKNGIEIEIDTHKDYRRRGIATILAKRMIAECGQRGLDCHWDAYNPESAALARKLGFKEERNYLCMELTLKK